MGCGVVEEKEEEEEVKVMGLVEYIERDIYIYILHSILQRIIYIMQ